MKSPPQFQHTAGTDEVGAPNSKEFFSSPQQLLNNQMFAEFGTTSVEKGENQYTEGKKLVINFGAFDDGENISFTDEEVQCINQVYEIFYLNRLHSTERKINDYHNYSFTPALCESSKKLANSYREKQLDETARYFLETQKPPPADGKLTHADLLIYQKFVQKRKIQEKIQEYAKRELDLCPFKPKILDRGLNSSQRENDLSNDSKRSLTPSGRSGIKRSEELFCLRKSFLEKRDQSYVEWYDRKFGDECTFKPAIPKRNKTFDAVDQSIENIPDVDKSIERIKRGRKQRELKSLMNSRGVPTNGVSTDKLPPFNCSLEKIDLKNQASQPPCSKRCSKSRTRTRENSSVINSGVLQENLGTIKSIPSETTKNSDLNETTDNTRSSVNHRIPIQRNSSSSQLNSSYHNAPNQQQPKQKQIVPPTEQNDYERDESRGTDQKEQFVPILFVDVNFGPGKSQRIVVYPGDRADDLANKFAQQYNLDELMKTRLQLMLESQIGSVLSKIEEEMPSRQSDTERERLSFGNKNDFL